MIKKNFQDIELKNCMLGKICYKGHIGPNGYNLRSMQNGACKACERKQPDGPYSAIFPDDLPVNKLKDFTPEQKAKHIQNVMAWQKRNKDKVKGYQSEYAGSEGAKIREVLRNKKNWDSKTPEEKYLIGKARKIRDRKKELQRRIDSYLAKIEAFVEELNALKLKDKE